LAPLDRFCGGFVLLPALRIFSCPSHNLFELPKWSGNMKVKGSAVQRFFFKAATYADDTWICNKCKKARKCSKGYTNLVTHAKSCIGPEFEDELIQHLDDHGIKVDKDGGLPKDIDQRVLDSFYRSNEKERRAYEWIKWICSRNQPLMECENKITKHFSKWKSFSTKTLRRYIIATAAEAAKDISDTLKKAGLISLLFDGWTCDGTSTHYIAIFAGYRDPSSGEYAEVLLSLQPTLDETDMGADAHINLAESTLEYYDLEYDSIACLVGDNCSTNRAISKRWNIPLIGCFNHKLNLAVQEYIANQTGLQEAVDKIATLMSKATCIKAAAQLRDLTLEAHGVSLKAKQKNKTRWTSTFEMTKRYHRIKAELAQIEELEPYQLTLRENRIIKNAQDDFEVFNTITVAIQEKGMDILCCREQFDIIRSDPKYECMEKYLSPTAEIVESPTFESAVVKIQQGLPLDDEEAKAARKLKREREVPEQESVPSEEEMTVMQRLEAARKRRKVQPTTSSLEYIDVTKLICATSNCCERLFSEAKYIMVPHRRAMSPLLFESLIYLKKNLRFWTIKTVAAAMTRAEKEEPDALFERDSDNFYSA
jgi:hypothetical protein